jgi:hypothetical protein
METAVKRIDTEHIKDGMERMIFEALVRNAFNWVGTSGARHVAGIVAQHLKEIGYCRVSAW